jgi:hypothetical protein
MVGVKGLKHPKQSRKDLRHGGTMTSSSVPTESSKVGWKELYTSALFETDKSKMAGKIIEAQTAILIRRRELMKVGADIRERQGLDTALLSLQALANCLELTPGFMPAVRTASLEAQKAQARAMRAGVQAA